MAISINWGTKVIYVPQDYLTPLGGALYQLDVNVFRLDLKSLEASEAGMTFPDTHRHNTEVTLGGVTYSRFIEFINGYTITFEDDYYAVSLVGANNNVADVTNVNHVSIRSANSAGLITVSSGSGLSTEEHNKLMALPDDTLTTEEHNTLVALPDAATISTTVWQENLALHTSTGTAGKTLSTTEKKVDDTQALIFAS